MFKRWNELSKEEKIEVNNKYRLFPRKGYASGMSSSRLYHYTRGEPIDDDLLYYPADTWYRKQQKRNNRKKSMDYDAKNPEDDYRPNPYNDVSPSSSDGEPAVIVPKKNKKGKKEYTDDQKKALVERLRKGRERAKARRLEKEKENKVREDAREQAKKDNQLPPKKTEKPPEEEKIVNDIKEVKPAEKKIELKIEEKKPEKKPEPEYVRVNVAEYKKTMEEIDNRWKARFHEFTSKYQNQKKEPAPAPAPKPINKPPPTPPIAIPARTLGRFNAPMW